MNIKSLFLTLCICLYSLNSYSNSIITLEQISNNKWVYEANSRRCLSFLPPPSKVVQSCMDLQHPDLLIFNYLKMLAGSLYINPAPKKILMIGLGGASLPKALAKILPNVKIDVVEIDHDIIVIAEKYFFFKANNNINIFEQDGFSFVKNAVSTNYDIVIIDAFNEDYIPTNFLTIEFVTDIKRILKTDGVVAINTFVKANKYFQLESELFQQVFGNIINLVNEGNRVIIASNKNSLPFITEIRKNAEHWQVAFEQLGIEREWLLEKFGIKNMKFFLPWEEGFKVN